MSVQTDPPIERRHNDLVGASSAKLYLFSALFLTVTMVVTSFGILLVNPAFLDLRQIRYLSYFLVAVITALFAAAGINVVNVLNGHQALLMRVVAEKERAQGVIEGLKENPHTNIS